MLRPDHSIRQRVALNSSRYFSRIRHVRIRK
jgi:hypothetical protein